VSNAHPGFIFAPPGVPSVAVKGTDLRFPVNRIFESGATVPYPPGTNNCHHEMELVVAIGKPAFCVAVQDAPQVILGYACGLDMTRRDLQFQARDKGRPWDLGKNFENSAVISEIVAASESGHIDSGGISLSVNEEVRQAGDISDLIWNVPELIADLSKYYHLQPGDLLYTGTPAGVGPVKPGDRIVGSIDQVGEITLTIAPQAVTTRSE
jgi:fumarylpyruvate hydrolase